MTADAVTPEQAAAAAEQWNRRMAAAKARRFQAASHAWLTGKKTNPTMAEVHDLPERRKPRPALPPGVDPHTELANSYTLIHQHGRNLRHTPSLGWLAFQGQRWACDDAAAQRCMRDVLQAELLRAAEEHDDNLYKFIRRSQARARIEAALALAQVHEDIASTPDAFDRDPMAFNVRNGTLDLVSGELRSHRRTDLITRLAPVAYEPHASAPTFEAFLARIFADDADLIAFVLRAIGYSLTGSTNEQVFFLLHGGGANGKSTLLELLRYLLGDYALDTPSDTLLQARERGASNDLARLRGARLVTSSETGEGKRLDEERIKRLTGGDSVVARYLYREHFEFHPTFKLWLATNHRPQVTDTSHAMWRRVRLIPFSVTIPDTEQDHTLGEKLKAEACGILRLVVDACRDWQRGGLRAPAAVTDATEGYRAEQDVIARFIGECCTTIPEASVMASQLYEAFVSWAKSQGERPLSGRAFGERIGKLHTSKHTKRGRCWRGLGLTAEGDG